MATAVQTTVSPPKQHVSEMVSSMAKVETELCKDLDKRIEEEIIAAKDWGRLGTDQTYSREKFIKHGNKTRKVNGQSDLPKAHTFAFEEGKYAKIPGELSYKLVNEMTLSNEAEAFLTKISQDNKQLYAINRYNMLSLVKGSIEKTIVNHNVFKKFNL